jgi:hypothetical protein
LLALVFHPDFEDNGLFYTYASEPVNGAADFSTMQINNPTGQAANCQNVLLEWRVQDPNRSSSRSCWFERFFDFGMKQVSLLQSWILKKSM